MKNDKEGKQNRLLNTAFKLFTEKGTKDTSIQEIVDNASVAKGTFYLYFKDKYEIRDILIVQKSQKLFSDALKSLRKNYISDFSDSIIYIINYVIDELTKNPLLLKFISKNLSWGVFNKTVLNLHDKSMDSENSVYDLFIKGIKENNIKIENPDVTFFSDYKSALQEYVQTEQKSLVYELVEELGPAHDRTFKVDVKIDDIVYGTGIGSSKKEAEQDAAKKALNKLAI